MENGYKNKNGTFRYGLYYGKHDGKRKASSRTRHPQNIASNSQVALSKGNNNKILTVYWSDYFSDNGRRSFPSECRVSNELSLYETSLRCFTTFNGQYADCAALSASTKDSHLSAYELSNEITSKVKSIFGNVTFGVISDFIDNGKVTVLIAITPVSGRHQYSDVVNQIIKAFKANGITVYPAGVVNGLTAPKAIFHKANNKERRGKN